MGNATSINVGEVLTHFFNGFEGIVGASEILSSGAMAIHQTDGLGDTNYVPKVGALSDGAFLNRREATITAHTFSDSQVEVTAYSLAGVAKVYSDRMSMINNQLAKSVYQQGGGVTEQWLANELAQVIVRKVAKLGIHTAVTAATSASMYYDITGETDPANKITVSTYLDFLAGMDLLYSPESAPAAAAYVTSPTLIADFKKLKNGVTNEMLIPRERGRLMLEGIPVIGFEGADADDGVITGLKGTRSSTAGDADIRLIKLLPNAVHLFATTDPRTMERTMRITESVDTGGHFFGVTYRIEIAALCNAYMNGTNKCGASYGLCNLTTA